MANSTDLELSLKKYLDSFLARPSKASRRQNTGFIVHAKNAGIVSGARVEIRIKEHAPPHFHVTIDKESASYAIEDCALLKGCLPKKRKSDLNSGTKMTGVKN